LIEPSRFHDDTLHKGQLAPRMSTATNRTPQFLSAGANATFLESLSSLVVAKVGHVAATASRQPVSEMRGKRKDKLARNGPSPDRLTLASRRAGAFMHDWNHQARSTT
jgi:hypothetical protein